MTDATEDMRVYTGGCHCGAVRFEVDAPATLPLIECNCSVCAKSGFLHVIVTGDAFRLLRGEDALTTYTFNTGAARHLFCRTCGIKSFYVPRSHPDGYSVNARCLDDVDVDSLTRVAFDGRNWEASIGEIT